MSEDRQGAQTDSKESVAVELLCELLDRQEVHTELILDWAVTDVIAIQKHMNPSHYLNSGAIPLGLAYSLVTNLRTLKLPQRVDRAARYMFEPLIHTYHATWINMIHAKDFEKSCLLLLGPIGRRRRFLRTVGRALHCSAFTAVLIFPFQFQRKIQRPSRREMLRVTLLSGLISLFTPYIGVRTFRILTYLPNEVNSGENSGKVNVSVSHLKQYFLNAVIHFLFQ